MIIEVVVGLFTCLLVWDYFYRKPFEDLYKQSGIKGPKYLPFIGNVLLALKNDTSNVFEMLNNLCKDYGKVVKIWVFGDAVLFVRDAKFFESILSSQQVIKKNRLYALLASWLGDGLLLSSGSKWHSRRKIITPTFHFKILEEFVEVFDQQSSVLVKRLRSKADGKTVLNMFPIICLTALDIIAETAMGVQINAQANPDFPYAKALTSVADIIATRFVRPTQSFDLPFKLFANKSYRKMMRDIKLMQEFTDKVIVERRTRLEESIKNGTFNSETNEMGIKKRMAFLDVLLQSTVNNKPLTNEDIREEVDTFMFEGHDTTTSGISHTLYLLARHPQVQQKVFEEILEVIGSDKDKPVSMRELQELKYLDAVIKESLRMYPPVPMIGRVTEHEVKLDGKTLPANVQVNILIYAACRDPDYFPNPDSFEPERFIGESSSEKYNPFSYVPFSAGPRNCIGQKFAVLEMKSTISKMLRHYELLPLGDDVLPVMNLILRSATGINLGLKPREY